MLLERSLNLSQKDEDKIEVSKFPPCFAFSLTFSWNCSILLCKYCLPPQRGLYFSGKSIPEQTGKIMALPLGACSCSGCFILAAVMAFSLYSRCSVFYTHLKMAEKPVNCVALKPCCISSLVQPLCTQRTHMHKPLHCYALKHKLIHSQ